MPTHPRGVILIIKWRRILRISWRRPRRPGERGTVPHLAAVRPGIRASWVSALPSVNHPVRLPVDNAGFRTVQGVAAHRSFDGQARKASAAARRAPACGSGSGLRQIPIEELRQLMFKMTPLPPRCRARRDTALADYAGARLLPAPTVPIGDTAQPDPTGRTATVRPGQALWYDLGI
jgi:hypothetical protein